MNEIKYICTDCAEISCHTDSDKCDKCGGSNFEEICEHVYNDMIFARDRIICGKCGKDLK